MGLLEGSGRGGKGADGTQREVHQRHVACQKSGEGTEEGRGGRSGRMLGQIYRERGEDGVGLGGGQGKVRQEER